METPAAETHQHEYLRQRQRGEAGGDLAVVQVELQEPVDLGSVLITSRDQSPQTPLHCTVKHHTDIINLYDLYDMEFCPHFGHFVRTVHKH